MLAVLHAQRIICCLPLGRGPTGMLLNELAEASFSYADCRIIFVRTPSILIIFGCANCCIIFVHSLRLTPSYLSCS